MSDNELSLPPSYCSSDQTLPEYITATELPVNIESDISVREEWVPVQVESPLPDQYSYERPESFFGGQSPSPTVEIVSTCMRYSTAWFIPVMLFTTVVYVLCICTWIFGREVYWTKIMLAVVSVIYITFIPVSFAVVYLQKKLSMRRMKKKMMQDIMP